MSKLNNTSMGTGLLLLLSLTLVACTGNTDRMLAMQDYVRGVVNRPPGTIAPLPEFVSYEAFTYSAAGQRSPFSIPMNITAVVVEQGETVQPDENRTREPLEAYEISNLRMVGSLARGNMIRALIQDPESNIHQVRVGNYLGRSHGRVVAVSPTQVDVVELVPNGAGGWLERPQVISLEQ